MSRRVVVALAVAGLVVPLVVVAARALRRPAPPPPGARFLDPEGLAVGPDGRLYVADEKGRALYVLTPDGATEARLDAHPDLPGGLVSTGGSLVATAPGRVLAVRNHDLVELDLLARPPRVLALHGGEGTPLGPFHGLEDVTIGDDGLIYTAEEDIRAVRAFRRDGATLVEVRRLPMPEEPESVHVRGGRLYVCFPKAHRVSCYDLASGALLWDTPSSGPGRLRVPDDVLVGPDGLVYVSDQRNDRIVVLDAAGSFVRALGKSGSGPGELRRPEDIAFGPDGALWVADSLNYRLQALDPVTGAARRVVR
ncbi:MAG: NHL repeat-containing protein [Planctomycetes bacterium]|nr:NHL repeat-containing protein [Planctomycetota bacterium]